MILIVGGTCQGKAEYARKLACELAGRHEPQVVDGMQHRWEDVPEKLLSGKLCVLNLHGFVRQLMEEGLEPDGFVRQLLTCPPEIVTLDEVGNGIVPLKRKDRDYREAVGRAGQLLAAEAQQVCRMVCGIPVRIK